MATATSSRPTLAAEPRDIVGKKVAALRRGGLLPGVVFGHGLDSTSVTVDAHDFELLRRKTGQNALVDLSVGDNANDPVRILIAVVAVAVIAGAIVVSKRRSVTMGDQVEAPATR